MQGPDFPRPKPETIEVLRRASTASITTILRRRGINKVWIPVKPLFPGNRIVGPALTLRNVPGREDIAKIAYQPGTLFPGHPEDAIEAIQPGDVMVHDGLGLTNEGLFGDLLSLRVKMKGAAGLVCDMAVRDAPHMQEHGLPVFCRGSAAPGGTVYNVDFNVPINCGGTLVIPGDIVVGDDDGVVVIPRAMVGDVVEDVLYHEEREEFLRLRLAEGAELRGTYPASPATDQLFREWREKRRQEAAPATPSPSGETPSVAEQHAIEDLPPRVYDYRHDLRNVVVAPEIRARFLRLEPGDTRELRAHDGAHQVALVLEGRCSAEIEGTIVEAGPGQLVHVFPGQRHVLRAAGSEPAYVYISLTPHREPTHVFFQPNGDQKPAAFGVWRDAE